MSKASFHPLSSYIEYPVEEMKQRAADFRRHMQRRRTVRQFSDRPVPHEVIEECLLAAGTAPSGANLQPWHFVVVTDPQVKHEIRVAAEQEEDEFYHRRAPQEWLDALSLIGTDEHKPFLETAPIDRRIRQNQPSTGWAPRQELLCERICWHSDRVFDLPSIPLDWSHLPTHRARWVF
jgi:nitroreductase